MCLDIDECQSENFCGDNYICTNSWSSYSCQCEYGFSQGKVFLHLKLPIIRCEKNLTKSLINVLMSMNVLKEAIYVVLLRPVAILKEPTNVSAKRASRAMASFVRVILSFKVTNQTDSENGIAAWVFNHTLLPVNNSIEFEGLSKKTSRPKHHYKIEAKNIYRPSKDNFNYIDLGRFSSAKAPFKKLK